jgi:hypothetical protein
MLKLKGYDVGPKRSKYGNKKTEYGGFLFDSKKEANYARELDLLKSAKGYHDKVHSWERQIPFEIRVNDIKICKYIADFRVNYEDGREEYIDVKGVRTDVYKIKKKLVEAQYGIVIKEV